MAVREAADFELKQLFSIIYAISMISAGIYMAGWLWLNLAELPNGPLTYHVAVTLGVTTIAGALHALLLPAVMVALGAERIMQRRLRKQCIALDTKNAHCLIESKAMLSSNAAIGHQCTS
jgi:hypothetical protein